MRTLALTLALAACTFTAAGGREDDGDAKKLQGRWVATALRHGDAETPKDVIEKGEVTLEVEGDRFTFRTPKETQKGTIQVDGSKKTIDLKITGKEGEKRNILCIYEFDGKTLRMAGNQDKRPKDFKSRLGGAIVVSLERAKR